MAAALAGRRVEVSRRDALLATLLVNAELAFVVGYFALTNATLTSPLFSLYGLVWVNVALLVLARYSPPAGSASTRRRAAAVAAGYLALLAVFGGVVGPPTPTTPSGLGVALLPPGWGPAVVYGGSTVAAVLMPAKVLGYAALAYLLYGTLVEASGAGVAGLLGVFSCVSCSLPILATVVASVFGGGGALLAAAVGVGYGPSTAVFLVTVALLWWRPGFDALDSWRS
ncbi:DUF7546 family protein [Halorarum salinum]|uniref:Uncharacterized protein n=1 Tax=Halorarum salinum TaxID=2743089 RepID=A0A7D5LA59_9EURY|nr:hypothetical protein [Halobaculum salinum]QLG61590.1 hypothetical protein HUG12_07560 [Halobaculum salinum]